MHLPASDLGGACQHAMRCRIWSAVERTELAWAAGFWDGEGSAYLVRQEGRRTAQPHARINQSSTTGMPEVLVRFEAALGFGSLQGPDLMEGREPLYRWVVSSRALVEAILERLEPWLGQVKRHQLQTVLGAPSVSLGRNPVDQRESLAWCAGLFDGEGSVYLAKHQSHAGHLVLEAAITQSSEAGTPEVLERFRDAFGLGKIYGPYPTGPGWAPVYRWKAHRRGHIEVILARLEPNLGAVKRSQAAAALAIVAAQPPLSRGNPAWGNRKTQCVNGHEYASARIRPYRARKPGGVQRRDSKQCLICVRESARRRRRERTMREPRLPSRLRRPR